MTVIHQRFPLSSVFLLFVGITFAFENPSDPRPRFLPESIFVEEENSYRKQHGPDRDGEFYDYVPPEDWETFARPGHFCRQHLKHDTQSQQSCQSKSDLKQKYTTQIAKFKQNWILNCKMIGNNVLHIK